jgi:hypothetical protein
MRLSRVVLVLVVAGAILRPSLAHSQVTSTPVPSPGARVFNNTVTGYLNWNAGGELEKATGAVTTGYGAALTLGRWWTFSAEVDVDFNPQYVGRNAGEISDSSLTTVTLGGILGPMLATGGQTRVRPYFALARGFGRSFMNASVDNTPKTIGIIDLGGGAFFFPSSRVGIRGDLRYRLGSGDMRQRGGIMTTLNYFRTYVGLTCAF